MINFKQLGVSEGILKALTELDYKTPTKVQQEALPEIKKGQDTIILSQTGSGKTFAFGVPVIEHINAELKKQQALIICPTRELATQVSLELKKLNKYMQGISIFAVFGGQPIYKQISMLKKKPQIIVGTPGRVLDHIKRRTLRLESVSMFVLDEADEMLKMGFREDIEAIEQKLAGKHQTVLASATMNTEIKALTKKFLTNPTIINAGGANSPAKTIKQEYVLTKPKNKKALLLEMLTKLNGSALIFCNTKKMTADLSKFLNTSNLTSKEIHGDMKQSERTRTMNAFKSSKIRVLVATDVAARGIDVSNINYVINYDYPQMQEYYIHRIGRTGRAGSSGIAYTFITTGNQMQSLNALSKKIDFKVEKSLFSTVDSLASSKQTKTRFNQKGEKAYSKNGFKNSKNSKNKYGRNKDSKYTQNKDSKYTKTTTKPKTESRQDQTKSYNKPKKQKSKNKGKKANDKKFYYYK